tara:strand:+ start:633 stop:1343 length:711 start_codon:yes stop_codon:yes gene_type:complete
MELSKRKIIYNSWGLLKGHFPIWIFIILFMFSLHVFISIIQDRLLKEITVQTILFIISSYLFQAGVNLGMIRLALNIHKNKAYEFKTIFQSFHILFVYIAASLIMLFILICCSLPGIISFVLFSSIEFDSLSIINIFNNFLSFILILFIIIPAAYISIRLQFYEYFLVDKECGPINAIKLSLNCTRGYAGDLFIIGFIMSLIILVSMIPLLLGLFISIPLSIMVNTHIYLKITNDK